jgi:biopolymer transport protein ExbD
MNFRRRFVQEPLGLQLAPMIDVILFLLVFFLITWNIARYEMDLDVKVPTAKQGKEPTRLPGEVIINVRKDGSVTLNQRTLSYDELKEILNGIVKQYPDQSVILRADEEVSYKYIVNVLDVCRSVDLWNIAFATTRPQNGQP